MARYVCPSCGASWNGRKCRECYYEHFSEEISHGTHTHKGEPLVIDSPVRRPIPRKDPFGCPKPVRRQRRTRQKHPIARFLALLFVIYSLLPMLRDWGLELEAREALAQPEMALPENLVTLHEEGPITISTLPECLSDPEQGIRIWVENDLEKTDVHVTSRYVTVNGFVLPSSGVYVDAAGGLYGMGTLYLYEEELKDANIRQVQEITFVLEATDEDYTLLFETDPITISTTENPVEPQWNVEGGLILIEEDGIYMESLGYFPNEAHPEYENGRHLFYIENKTDSFLSADSLEVTLDGEEVNLYLWANLPPHSRTVARMDLWGLETIEQPSELGNLTVKIEFWDPDNYTETQKEFTLTLPMNRTEPVVFY